jgi:hypothetical protein
MRAAAFASFVLCGTPLPFATVHAAEEERGVELHAQATYVRQGKPGFQAQYDGPKSFVRERAYGYSFTATAFLGANFGGGWEGYFNPELSQGVPLSSLQGLGGFNNGESQRASGDVLRGYRARAFARKTWNIDGELDERESAANQVRTRYAARRFVLTAGNLAVLDIFDAVDYSRDPRTQFLNWGSLTYGAWDYPADSRGYTWGAVAEYITPAGSIRAGRFLMPVESNGLTLNRNFTTHYGDAIELERPVRLGERKAVLRALAFHNRVNAGAYRDAFNVASPPDVTVARRIQGKSGVGASAQVELAPDVGAYVRAGWNDGKTESYAFTEIDRSLASGVLFKGARWRRAEDSAGIAGYVNGLSKDHRDYLAAGGQGFFLADGRLSYSAEKIVEVFYSLGVLRGIWLTANFQRVTNPGYNRDRGPAQVYNLRAHVEF